jgi:hypothetical protein
MKLFNNPHVIEKFLFFILVIFMSVAGFFYEYFKSSTDGVILVIAISLYLILCFLIYRWTLKTVLSRIDR